MNQYKIIVPDISPVKRVNVSDDVIMTTSDVENYGVLFLATNSGNLYVYEVSKGVLIFIEGNSLISTYFFLKI